MKKDLFIWTLATVAVISIVYTIILFMGIFLRPLQYYIFLAIISIPSIILYVRKNPEKALQSGGIIVISCFVATIMIEVYYRTIMDLLTQTGIMIGIFLIGGGIGHFLRKKEYAEVHHAHPVQ